MNYTAVLWVNGIRQTMAETVYHDRDDALRRCFIWRCAYKDAPFGPVQAEIHVNGGLYLTHHDIYREIGRRPELRRHPSVL